MEKYYFCSHIPWPLIIWIIWPLIIKLFHTPEKKMSTTLYLTRNTCSWPCETSCANTHEMSPLHFYSLCLVLAEGKTWPFLIFNICPFPPSVVYFHDHLQFMSSFSHCVLLWQDNSISLIQYALCLYLHAPVTVPLVREGVVSFSSSEVSSPSLLCLSLFQKAFSSASHKAAYLGFCLMILNGSFACSQMWGEYRKQRKCLCFYQLASKPRS